MTRETKVGLLIGLGVILFIGILISDHLSVAQRQVPATLTQFTDLPPDNPSNTRQGLLAPHPINRSTQPETTLPDQPSPSKRRTPVFTPRELSSPAPTESSTPRPGPDKPHPTPDSPHAPRPWDPAPTPIAHAVHPTPSHPTTDTLRRRTTPPRRILVKPGDNLSDLAQRHLGSESLWRRLYQANRDQLHNPDLLTAGMRLQLPKTSVAPDLLKHADAPPRTASPHTYTVQTGDTLSSIAQATLGDHHRWPEVFDLNKDQLNNPDDLRVGQTLRVPGP